MWAEKELEKLRVLAGNKPLRMAYNTGVLLFVPDDGIMGPAFIRGPYEPYETSLVQDWLRPGDAAIDVGAHCGFYSIVMAERVGTKGRVVAIEPDPFNLWYLRKNVLLNHAANVSVIPAAAVKEEGETDLYLCQSGNSGDHRLWLEQGKKERSVPVNGVRIDSIHPVGSPTSFLKIDTQGTELDVLKGAVQTIADSKRLAMAVEYWPWGIRQYGSDPEEFCRFLFERFHVYLISEYRKGCLETTTEKLLALPDLTPDGKGFGNLWCVKK
jgi:FkbM family methyltransferase